MNTQQMIEEIDRLARLCEAKDEAIAQQKERNSIMKSNMQINEDEHQEQISEAQAQIAMKDEALNCAEYALVNPSSDQQFALNAIRQALSATSETVAAWRAKETEQYKREVAMQNKCIELFFNCFYILTDGPDESDEAQAMGYLQEARELRTKMKADTKATALAYEQEVKAKAIHDYRINALVPTDAEEYLETSLMTWELLDEVEAHRNGVALTHCGADPVAFFHDKHRGLLPRKFLVESLEKARQAAELRKSKGE